MADSDDYWDQIRARKPKRAPKREPPPRDPPITRAEMAEIMKGLRIPAPEVPVERMRRRRKSEPAPVEPPKPLTADDMRAIVQGIPQPEVKVPQPRVNVLPTPVTVQPPVMPEINVPAPNVTIGRELDELVSVSEQARDLLKALVMGRSGRIKVEILERDENGNISAVDVVMDETKH